MRCMCELADEAVFIGPAPSRESYLVMDKIIAAAQQDRRAGGASRLRLPVGEAGLCQKALAEAGIVFIGPTPMRSPPWATRSTSQEARAGGRRHHRAGLSRPRSPTPTKR